MRKLKLAAACALVAGPVALLRSTLLAGTTISTLLLPFAAIASMKAQVEPSTPPGVAYTSPTPAENRRVFFGELHLHTSLSFDAWTAGTKLSPEQAYAFGRGDTVMVPAYQVHRQQGTPATAEVPARRSWPLDFMAVTDHAESMGIFRQLDDPQSAFAQSSIGKQILTSPGAVIQQMFNPDLHKPLPDSMKDPAAMNRAWVETVQAANRAYQPGRFTTFIGYEWTASPANNNLHRNVIFNANDAPPPFTSEQSARPEDLWQYLEAVRTNGRDVIAIPHNSNVSGGMMFDWNSSDQRPIDDIYARRRATNEPLTEMSQIKGQSETTPELSPTDEFADFEIYDRLLGTNVKSDPNGSHVRQAYGRGLSIEAMSGVNPFKFGVVGGSDIHNGLSVSSEAAFVGGPNAGIDPKTMMPKGEDARRIIGSSGTVVYGSAALTGVWAEENTRNSIFAALKRKETFATSGTKIRVRMFGGWEFEPSMLRQRDWVKRGYERGVPMGSDLPQRPTTNGTPTFVLEAVKDPDGANLDRIQIVKVWLAGGITEEKIFDVVLSGNRRTDPTTGRATAVGNTVNLKTGVYQNSIGSTMLSAVWRDPEFDGQVSAVYYARVLEIPTPRWTTLLAISNDLPLSDRVASTIQERAWSSPIWFTPTRSENLQPGNKVNASH